MDEEIPIGLQKLATPCFVVDRDICARNAKTMLDKCKELGVLLRPHMKTHKTRELGEMMTGGTKRKIVVSTLTEAEFYADAGFDDILYGIPLIESKFGRCQQLMARLDEFHVMVDSKVSTEALINTPVKAEGKQWSVFVNIDAGTNREGVPIDSEMAVEIPRLLSNAENVKFAGIYVFCGLTYMGTNKDETKALSETVASRLLQFKQRLSDEGIECKSYSTGSTPTIWNPGESVGKVTEIHAGCYIFNDWVQSYFLGCCDRSDVAIRVLTRIVGVYPHRNKFLVDCGWTCLSADLQKAQGNFERCGYAAIVGHPELRIANMDQEFGVITSDEPIDFEKFQIGKMLSLIPRHSCATACMQPQYTVVSKGEVVEYWKPCRGF